MSDASEHPVSGEHLELAADEQLARARPWEAAAAPVLDDLSDDEEADIVNALAP